MVHPSFVVHAMNLSFPFWPNGSPRHAFGRFIKTVPIVNRDCHSCDKLLGMVLCKGQNLEPPELPIQSNSILPPLQSAIFVCNVIGLNNPLDSNAWGHNLCFQ